MQLPYAGSGKGDGAHKAFHVSVKGRRDPPPVLDAAEHALDGIAAIVRGLVIILLAFKIAARRNDGLRVSFFEPFAQRAAALVLVGDEFGGGRLHRDANLHDLTVVDASGRQKQDAVAAPAVADGMEITVAAALRAADAMAKRPLFPPQAQLPIGKSTLLCA